MWINDKVKFFPEITEVSYGPATEAVVKGVSADGTSMLLVLENGNEERVESRLCELVNSHDK